MSFSSDSEGNDTILVGPGDVRDFNAENILPLPAEDLIKIREWLQPTPYDQERSEYSRHRASHLVGTGKWLMSTTTYQQWHQGDDNGLLWIKGIPGSGKSVMAASIIDQLRKEEVPVLHFFFRQIIDANHKPVAALRDWLCQVLHYSPPLQVKLKGYIDQRRSLDSLSPSDLWKDLKLALASFDKAYCVTDALDEMDQGNDDFLLTLVQLGQWSPSDVKVLITSRPVATVENALRSVPIPQIRLEERLVDIDIATYVQYRLRSSSVPREHWSIIEEAVPGRANGLFLYAKLSMDAFVEPGTDAREVLKALPADLNVMYNELLREHARRSNVPDELQLLVLQFVTHATRPLRLLEIAEMVKTHLPNEDRSLKTTKDLVRAACGPLLEILPDETVSVIHHSFTEFLKGFTRSSISDDSAFPVLQVGPTNQRLAVACLDYLRSGSLDNLKVKKRRDEDEFYHPKKAEQSELRLKFPFLEYAAGNWYSHACRAALAGADMSLIHNMLDTFFAEKKRFSAWLDIDWPTVSIQNVTPLHVAAWTGLAQYATLLLQKGEFGTEARDGRQNTPLYWAASSGKADVVQVLLANGAELDAEQNEGLKALHVAAKNNRAEVVKILLAAGVDPLTRKTQETPGRRCGNAPTSIGHTPLMYACHNGHVEAVAEFLPFLKDIETVHRALVWASEKGHAAVVHLVLQHPVVDVNAKYRGDTALFKACEVADQKTIDVLLRAGADPNILCSRSKDEFGEMGQLLVDTGSRRDQKPRGFTALHALCGTGKWSKSTSPKCAQLLIKAGADVHLQAPDGSTALHYACKQNINLVKPLLEAGADPAVETDSGTTPLHTDGRTDKELLPLLLGTGIVDINKATGKDGKTPLLCRLESYRTESILAFLAYKPDVNATDVEGNGAFHMALENWNMKSDIINELISAGADPNLKNRKGDTPLHTMRGDNAEFVSKLLNAGANLEARNHDGQTALFKHITAREPELFQTLIDLGARLDARDFKGQTLLHQCCHEPNRLDYLIGLGLDPTVTDYEGNTLLHCAAARKSASNKLAILKHLSDLSLDIDQPNHSGRTVLHMLCARSDDESHLRMEGQPLDYVLQVCKNLNPGDFNGVQPLHLAATVSEEYVFKLLNAGADVFEVTHEGMTVLHIAARARQPNIVSLVLSELVRFGEVRRKAFVNQRNKEGKAALHYACRSGRPETVKALLEAGADPNLGSPFRECADFEAEQELWSGHGQKHFMGQSLNAAGVLLDDKTRPYFDQNGHTPMGWSSGELNTEQDTTRLDEILNLLVRHGAVVTGENGSLQPTFLAAVSNQHEYTVDCLSRLSARIPDAKPINYSNSDEGYLTCTYRLEATKRALREIGRFDNVSAGSVAGIRHFFVIRLIARRQYDLFEEIIAEGVDTIQVDYQGRSLLHLLVRWGYKDLLARVCTHNTAVKFDDHEWCRQAEEICCEGDIAPLLVTACGRRLPNMDVVELLVGEMGVNINAQRRERVYRKGYQVLTAAGALHKLAAGHSWWHVDEALPYLIKMGANLELRDENGATPLHIALDCSGYKGAFYKKAAKILIESGADINAVDASGKTCLSKAGKDLELIRLLIAHGAKVSAAAIFSAIELMQVDALELLLSQGNHANLRRPGPAKPRGCNLTWDDPIVESEVFPLLHAARYQDFCGKNVDVKVLRPRVMTALLNHGADPFATFVKYVRVLEDTSSDESSNDDSDEESDLDQIQGSGKNWKPQRRTVIHEILSCGHLVEPLFQLPSLQLEHRDPSGCTLLLAASKNHETLSTKIDCMQEQGLVTKILLQELIDRGADVTAEDNDGKTILHHIGEFKSKAHFAETLKTVITNNPSLIHHPDRAGDTPLHYALRLHAFEYINLLLENGADPLQPDSSGDTALHHLAGKLRSNDKAKPLFKQLLEAGVDINSRNNKGDTPLFKYIETGVGSYSWPDVETSSEEFTDFVFDLFQEAGADFFAHNNAGSSLLHLLASKKIGSPWVEHGLQKVVERFKFLMDLGLDPMAEDGRQRTSLDVAAACGSEHILKLFERKPME